MLTHSSIVLPYLPSQDAVATYLQNAGLPPASSYNATGRAFPDVSAIGMNFWIYCGGLPTEVGGTSAATPTFAGIISLLNDARLAAGKKQLGFVNPLLYAHPEVFTDIMNGHNTGMGGCQTDGFDSVKGWGKKSSAAHTHTPCTTRTCTHARSHTLSRNATRVLPRRRDGTRYPSVRQDAQACDVAALAAELFFSMERP